VINYQIPAVALWPAPSSRHDPCREQADGRQHEGLGGASAAKGQGMIRKTMRIGQVRTSIKLEPEFWAFLKEMADERRIRLSALVNTIADATPDRTNLASTLRTAALRQAQQRGQTLQRERDRLMLAGSTHDLTRVLEACPLPCLVLDQERTIKQLNRAFAGWLALDPQATLGQKLDHVMIVRGPATKSMWTSLADGLLPRARFHATYVSPGKVRTAEAVAVALGAGGEPGRPMPAGYAVLFETLAERR
jgi:predicted DNA-binding ribbon-helix-helix protein